MSIGSQVGPKQFGGAWWIIHCLNKHPATTQPFDAVKDDCRTAAMLAKGIPANSKKVDADFDAFQKSANIQAFWSQYSQDVAPGAK